MAEELTGNRHAATAHELGSPVRFGRNGPRVVTPEDARDERVAGCSVWAQLLYERLRPQCDDQGRALGAPKVVAAACMPLVDRATPPTVEKWLDELARAGLIIRYERDGLRLLQFARWHDEQRGLRRTLHSRWPPPDNWTDLHKDCGCPLAARNLPADSAPDARLIRKRTDPEPEQDPDPSIDPEESIGGGSRSETPIGVYERRTGRPITLGARQYLARLTSDYGHDAVAAALEAAWVQDSNTADLLSRSEAELAAARERAVDDDFQIRQHEYAEALLQEHYPGHSVSQTGSV